MNALVLAAGVGARMGGPKGRLLVAGVPLAIAHALRAREVGAGRVVVVLREADLAWFRAEAARAGVVASAIASLAEDQAGSLAAGMRALGEAAPETPTLIAPVDTVPAAVRTQLALLEALDAPGVLAVTPRFADRGGHPVVVRAGALAGLGGPSAATLRQLLGSLGHAWIRVPVDDAAVVTDLDAPDDVMRLTGAPPRFSMG